MNHSSALRAVKVVHTAVWAFFVACILGAPIAAHGGHFSVACVLIALVAFEALVLVLNGWVCPLTGIAAHHTASREPNFDIYLPRWLARNNKRIFTPLYLFAVAYTAFAWWRHTPAA